MHTLDKKILNDLWGMRGQAFAIMLIIGIGVAVFVMALGTVDSLESTRQTYYQRYHFADIFMSVRRAPETLVPRLNTIPGVQQVSTGIAHNVVLDIAGIDEPVNGLVVSAPEHGAASLNNLHIRKGRMVRSKATDEIVVTESFANANRLVPGSFFHATLKGQRRKMVVVGIALSPEYVFFSVPGTLAPDDRRFGVLWMDRAVLAEVFDLDGAFNNIALNLQPNASESNVIQQLNRMLLNYGGVDAYGRSDHMSHATLSGEIAQLSASIHIAAPIFLGVIAFLINMLMLRYVETERQHIGVLKAFGYSNVQIAWHYGKFVLLIVTAGVAIGIAFGIWLGRSVTEMYAAHYHFPFLDYVLSPVVLIEAVVTYGLAGALGAFGNVRRAARLEPAVAMRPALPPVYQSNRIETVGLWLALDQPTHMMLRHIFRWPGRSAMTLLGIAAAMSTFIVPFGVSGSVGHMIDTHFFQAERQDLTVSFAQERHSNALIDLVSYPGILHAEGFRAVLAKLRAGNKARRITILGRRPGTTLTRPLDKSSKPMLLPEKGVCLSASLAKWLGVGVGDIVELEFLQGRRLTRMIPVTAITASYLGMTFFTLNMDLATLNELMIEGDVISGANLKIDPTEKLNLYNKLKQTPSITGVISHTASLATMRRLLQETLKMTVVNGFFAATIIFGVIYNNARISFTERRNEFATMLMLGYGRFEIFYIVLSELALLTLMATPLGCIGGYGLSWLLTEGTANEIFRIPLHLSIDAFGIALLFTFGSVALSSLAILHLIARLDIVNVLKTNE
ncbi:MAG: FtsX-like permease family protein [Methylococcales bacterium]